MGANGYRSTARLVKARCGRLQRAKVVLQPIVRICPGAVRKSSGISEADGWMVCLYALCLLTVACQARKIPRRSHLTAAVCSGRRLLLRAGRTQDKSEAQLANLQVPQCLSVVSAWFKSLIRGRTRLIEGPPNLQWSVGCRYIKPSTSSGTSHASTVEYPINVKSGFQ